MRVAGSCTARGWRIWGRCVEVEGRIVAVVEEAVEVAGAGIEAAVVAVGIAAAVGAVVAFAAAGACRFVVERVGSASAIRGFALRVET